MTRQSDRWWKSMIAKHGSREAVTAFMQAAQQKSMLNPNKQKGQHHGGFNKLTKEELSAVGKKGAEARWREKRD